MKNRTTLLASVGLIIIGIIVLFYTSKSFLGLSYCQGATIYPFSVIISLILRTVFKRKWVSYLPAIGLFIVGILAIIKVSIDKNSSPDDFGLGILMALGIISIVWAVILSEIMFLLNRFLYPLNQKTLTTIATISRWMILLVLPIMILIVYNSWAEPLSNINHFAVIGIQSIIVMIMALVSFIVIRLSKHNLSLPLYGTMLFILSILGTLIFKENDLAIWALIASMAFLEGLFIIDNVQIFKVNRIL